jgi:hypothetical protein
LSSRRQHADGRRILLEELSGLSERPMIIRMTTTASRPPHAITIGSGIVSSAPGT